MRGQFTGGERRVDWPGLNPEAARGVNARLSARLRRAAGGRALQPGRIALVAILSMLCTRCQESAYSGHPESAYTGHMVWRPRASRMGSFWGLFSRRFAMP